MLLQVFVCVDAVRLKSIRLTVRIAYFLHLLLTYTFWNGVALTMMAVLYHTLHFKHITQGRGKRLKNV